MSNVTREEVIELLRNFQQRMAAKRGMCDEHDGALWDNAESVIAALQAAEPAAWLFPDMTWTPISAMGRDHKGKEVFALPCPPAKAQVPDEAFNIIEGIRAELTWSGWRSARSRDWVMGSVSELLSMLTASPAPDRNADADKRQQEEAER